MGAPSRLNCRGDAPASADSCPLPVPADTRTPPRCVLFAPARGTRVATDVSVAKPRIRRERIRPMLVHQFVRRSIAFAMVLTATAALADEPARGGYRDS